MSANSSAGAAWRRFLYNHNPLYLVSAWMVLHGVRVAIADNAAADVGAVITPLLCGYMAALAVAGWLVVRVAKFWEDARTILLVLLLMYAGLSTAYDQLCLRDPGAGARHLLIGFTFCCVLTEAVLWSLRVRLAAAYRGPLYLQLAVLFAFPAWLGGLSAAGRDAEMLRGVLLFPVAAGAALLALWPATRRAPAQDTPNGTPWRWPLYPWSIFVVMATALAVRSWLLSISFSPAYYADPAFSLYFLCLPLVACCLLAMELALRTGNRGAQAASLAGLLATWPLAFPGWNLNPAQERLVELAERSLAAPPMVVAWTVAAAALYAWWRKAALGEWAAMAALALAACVDVDTRSLTELHAPHPWMLAGIAAWQLATGAWRRASGRMLLGGGATIVLAAQHAALPWGERLSPEVLAQLTLVWAALLPLYCRDGWARWFRGASPYVIAAATAGVALATMRRGGVPWWLAAVQSGVLAALAATYWRVWRDRRHALTFATAAALSLLLWTAALIESVADPQLQAGLLRYFSGCLMLLAAVAVSLWKAGVAARLWRWVREASAPPQQTGEPTA